MNPNLLLRLLRMQGHRCFWCDYLITRPGPSGERLILRQSRTDIVWLWRGWTIRAGWASVDHIWPRWRWPENINGRDDIGNLVAACKECNEDRGALHGPASIYDPTGLDAWLVRRMSESGRGGYISPLWIEKR